MWYFFLILSRLIDFVDFFLTIFIEFFFLCHKAENFQREICGYWAFLRLSGGVQGWKSPLLNKKYRLVIEFLCTDEKNSKSFPVKCVNLVGWGSGRCFLRWGLYQNPHVCTHLPVQGLIAFSPEIIQFFPWSASFSISILSSLRWVIGDPWSFHLTKSVRRSGCFLHCPGLAWKCRKIKGSQKVLY